MVALCCLRGAQPEESMRGLLFSLRVMGTQTEKKSIHSSILLPWILSLTFFVQFMLFSAKMS